MIYAVEICRDADREHEKSQRQYAHVYHRQNVICVARDFYKLPNRHRLALLLHEVGHLLAGRGGGEMAADRAAYDLSGVKIYYEDGRYGEQLESIKPEDYRKARKALGI